MNSNFEIISKEIIKPSSQTPDHLNIFKLSFFDQFAPMIYSPIIVFYYVDESKGLTISNHVQISQNLKKSLSETLTSFYPLAGRVRGSIVDCNDAGVEFIDTRVHSKLTESIREPDVEHLKNLIPHDLEKVGSLLRVQLNVYDCGGIALGISVWHQIADIPCTLTFLTAWAATHSRAHKTCRLGFQLSTLFPSCEISGPNAWETLMHMPDENLATKMLVFTKEKLEALRRTVTSSTESTIKDPTRVELVSAFIWQHLSHFFKADPKKGSFGAFHSVNMRARVGQKYEILKNAFGNFIVTAFVLPDSDGVVEELHESVVKFRSTIRSFNGDIPIDKESQECMINDFLNIITNREIEWYPFSSWCRFPIYEVDFGHGKPIWVCTSPVERGVKNLTFLLDSKDGEGVEVWLTNMDRDFVKTLETQVELI